MKKTYIIAAIALLTVTIEVAGTVADTGTVTVYSASELSVDKFMETVHKFADVRLEKGRDRYGDEHSPLFASALDRNSLDLPGNPPDIAGIRWNDRSQWGGNPHHDENFYLMLYAMSEVSGDDRYATAADDALQFFFKTQSSTTGLYWWGEHANWHFKDDEGGGDGYNTHEFFRPWVLWDEWYRLAPDEMEKFALGLWDNQIHDKETGTFSRHAGIIDRKSECCWEFPRHGGFYIRTWSEVFKRTGNDILLVAIETLVDYFENRKDETSGAIPHADRDGHQTLSPSSNLSLALDLIIGAGMVPAELSEKMLKMADGIIEIYCNLDHNLAEGGSGGFASGADITTLEITGYTGLWPSGYGGSGDAQYANTSYELYLRTGDDRLKDLVVKSALRFTAMDLPDPDSTDLQPKAFGQAIMTLLNGYRLSGQSDILLKAYEMANFAISVFWNKGSSLPRASTGVDHFEAITCGDTVVLALFELSMLITKPELNIHFEATDR